MLSLQSLQNKLLTDVVPLYNKNVLQATSINDVAATTRLMFNQVKDLVFPDWLLTLVESNDPQDLEKIEEEQKFVSPLVDKVAIECRNFENAQNVVKKSIESEQKENIESIEALQQLQDQRKVKK